MKTRFWMILLVLSVSAWTGRNVTAQAVEPVTVVNKGVGGNTTRDGLDRFERDVLEVKPDHLVLYFGINDACNQNRHLPVEQYKANLKTMIERARKAGVRTVVLTTPNPVMEDILGKRHPKHPHRDNLSAHLAQFDAAVREVARQTNCPLADLRKMINDHGGARPTRQSLIRNPKNGGGADGVHLTPEGYRKMAELYVPILADRVKPGETIVCLGDSITYGAHVEGAGTAFGETYPAWLWVLLNRKLGATERDKPAAPPVVRPAGQQVYNGSAEIASDGVHADHWRLWIVEGRQEGDLSLGKGDAAEGRHYLRVVNKNDKAPAYLLNTRGPMRGGFDYRISFAYRGTGKVRPVMTMTKLNKPVVSLPDMTDRPYIQAGPEWKRAEVVVSAPAEVNRGNVFFRITGTVDVDDVSVTRVKVKPPEGRGAAKPIDVPRTGGLAAVAKDNPLALAGAHVAVAFLPPEKGGAIRQIADARGNNFIKHIETAPLWTLELRKLADDKQREPTINVTLDPETDDGATGARNVEKDQSEIHVLESHNLDGAKTSVEQVPHGLVMRWQGVGLPGEPGVLDVTVTATLAPNDRFVRFRTTVNNRSRAWTVFYVKSPFVQNIYPPDGKTKLDQLASPIFAGRLITDPITNGILGQPTRFQPNRSGHSMQFDSYTHGDHGLYLGCFDGEQTIKRYYMEADPRKGFGWAVVHVPDNMKTVGQVWTTPYDTVLTCFRGTWYDAAQIYRDWALQQSWTREGPMHLRTSTPEWFKEIDTWLSWGIDKKNQDILYDSRLWKHLEGLNVGIKTSYWGKGRYFDHMNPDRFPLPEDNIEFLARADKRKLPVLAYIQGIIWDRRTEVFDKLNGFDHTVRNYYDQRLVWFDRRRPEHHDRAIAHPGPVWGKALGDTLVKMAEAGFDTAYLDSFNHGGTYMNFNPLYGRAGGGGNTYIKANQAMFGAMRKRVRKVNPGFCFTAESFWEGNIAQLDGFLTVNTTNQPLETGKIETVPLAHAVYADRTIFYSQWINRYDLERPGAGGHLAKTAQSFCWGVKPGWNQPNMLLEFDNHDIALPWAEKRYRAYHVSKKFLVYGQMLRPARRLDKVTTIPIEWYRAWSERHFKIRVPEVMHALWRSPEGDVGLVLTNIAPEARTVNLELTDPQYGFTAARSVEVKPVWPAEPEQPVRATIDKGTVTLTVTIPARSPMVVQLEPVH